MGWLMRHLAANLSLAALILVAPLTASTSLAESLSYVYDDLGRLESLTYEDGTQILYSYDAAGNRTGQVVRLRSGPTPPVAIDDAYGAIGDTTLTIDAPGVVDNDSDADGDALTATLVTFATNGIVVLSNDGSFSYTPDAGFLGSDSFTYRADDGAANSNNATVSITVVAPNIPPVAVADNATTSEEVAVTIGVLANDTDADSGPLTIVGVTSPGNGMVLLDDGGTPGNPSDDTIVYTPEPDFAGQDSFTYTIDDGQGGSASATVTVTVDPVNDAPVAGDDAFDTAFNTPLAVPAPGILSNDVDAEGDTLTPTLFADVSNGTLVLSVDGSFTYTPNAGFIGADSFSYTVSDGVAASGVATVTIEVGPPAGIASDDFSGASLASFWSLQGPGGSFLLSTDSADAYLELAVPLGNFNPWNQNNAVRMMQSATNQDFGIKVRFLSSPTQAFQMQGILIEQDANNWIRYDTYSDGSIDTLSIWPGRASVATVAE